MRRLPAACAILLPLLVAPPAWADDPAPPTPRPVNEVPTIRFGDATWANPAGTALSAYGADVPVMGAPLPAGRLDAVPVEDYLRTLQARIPRFRYVVRRQPGLVGGGPALPALETTDLTLGEFVNYVNRNCPGVQIEPDTSVSEVDPLYVVTLSAAPGTTTAPAAEAAPVVVKTFSLRAVVLNQRHVHRVPEEQATADVLSLVEAVIDASPGGQSVKLKVHSPTATLIFIGNADLAGAVENTLNTLAHADNQTDMFNENQQQVEEDRQEIERLHNEISALRAATRPAAGK